MSEGAPRVGVKEVGEAYPRAGTVCSSEKWPSP